MEKYCVPALLLLLIFLFSLVATVSASEVRTVELFPFADSYVNVDSPTQNYGKELHLRSSYENQRIVVAECSFYIGTAFSRSISVSLPKNGEITGSFDVTGGDINFRIYSEDRSTTFVNEVFVESLEFSFTAPSTSDFILSFENLGWFVPGKTVSLSDVVLTLKLFGAICSPIFLQFDLSDIPPEATINSAKLELALNNGGESEYNLVKAFHCTVTNWAEQTITYENAPLSESSLIASSLSNVTKTSIGNYSEWDIKPDVVRSLQTGKLTEILTITESDLPSSAIRFFSRESEKKPKLTITYTYVSVSSSAPSAFLIEGQSIAVEADTDPTQTAGTIKMQYSTNQVEWFDIESLQGGSVSDIWTPPVSGQVYVRSLWETSWSDGTYTTFSSISSVFIIPIYLIVLLPIVVIVIIVGIYFWRKRRTS